MTNEKAETSLVTLGNAAELVTGIILNVVGNDVADSLNGSPVGVELLNNIAQARFQKELNLN